MSYAIQWSENERNFFVIESEKAFRNTVRDFVEGDADDYVTLAIANSPVEATRIKMALAEKRGIILS